MVLLLAVGTWATLRDQASPAAKESGDKGAVPLEFSELDIVYARPQALTRRLSISGSLATPLQAQVKSKVAGQILSVPVREGDAVKRGQVLARLDIADLQSRLDAALADQAERQARLTLAKANRDNNQTLLERNFISRNAVDQTESAFQAAVAALRWADAQVQLARNAVNDAVVVAPIDGFIAKRHVNPGERVMQDSPLLTVVDLSKLELEATVPVSDVPRLQPGQEVRFSVDGFPDRQFTGKVDRINPTTEANTRAIRLFVRVANTDGALRGGMFASGVIDTGSSASAPVLPTTAVFEEAGQRYVFVIDGGSLHKRPVKVVDQDDTSGLLSIDASFPASLPVVRLRMATLKDGAPATVKAAAPTATPVSPPAG